MKNIIEKAIDLIKLKNDQRNEFHKLYFASWNEEAEKYAMEEPKEIDQLASEILSLIKLHINILPIDFIIESVTELGWSPSIIYDDNGNFAITGCGFQSISLEDKSDCELSFFIKKENWFPTIREAIIHYFSKK